MGKAIQKIRKNKGIFKITKNLVKVNEFKKLQFTIQV